MIENQIWLDKVIRYALEEDLGAGDLTTDAIIDPIAEGKAANVPFDHVCILPDSFDSETWVDGRRSCWL